MRQRSSSSSVTTERGVQNGQEPQMHRNKSQSQLFSESVWYCLSCFRKDFVREFRLFFSWLTYLL